MNNCQITFEEDGKKIIVDFTVNDNGDADYKINFDPKVNKDDDIGLKGHLCQLFIAALHSQSSEAEDSPDEN